MSDNNQDRDETGDLDKDTLIASLRNQLQSSQESRMKLTAQLASKYREADRLRSRCIELELLVESTYSEAVEKCSRAITRKLMRMLDNPLDLEPSEHWYASSSRNKLKSMKPIPKSEPLENPEILDTYTLPGLGWECDRCD